MTFIEQINELYIFLNTPQNSFYVLLGFLGTALLAAILRIIVCAGYQAQLTLFQLNAKEIKNRGEIKDTRSTLLNRTIKDYLRTGDKGVVPRTARNAAERNINRFTLLGWSYDGVSDFVTAIERNIVFLGIILAVTFEEYRYIFAICTVAAFLVLRLFAAIFNFTALKFRLLSELSDYVEREIGQFYAGDTSSVILRFKNEMSAVLLKQSENLGDAIKKMGADLSGVLRLGLQEMSKSVDATMIRVSDFGGELSVPLANWKNAVNDTAKAQERLNGFYSGLENASKSLESSATGLSKNLSGYSERLEEQSKLIHGEITQLREIAAGLKKSNAPLAKIINSLEAQLNYIEKNQEGLEKSLQRYELNMEELVRKLGDGLGSIIEYHLRSSYGALNNSLEDNIKQIVAANNSLAERMQEMLANIYEQSRSESQAVLKIKEQMDLHFENLAD